jgi:glycosyltransferase involved in cell wall biosynthesis
MKIVQANKFFFLKGGAERYFLDLCELQMRAGHDVIPFAMSHADNRESPFTSYFPSEIDYNSKEGSSLAKALRTIYSREAQVRLERLIDHEKPDIVHVHNIYHQLTPSILRGARSRGVPVIQTLHDYKVICPSYLMIAYGKPCERCKGGRFYMAGVTRCHRESFAASAVVAIEAYVHRALKSHNTVQKFLCPSGFLLNKFAEFGIARDRLERVPYFLPVELYRADPTPGHYYVYLGRLSREKGLATLLEAAERASGIPLRIVGDGPLRDNVLNTIKEKRMDWVTYDGFRSGDELHDTIRGAAFTVVPSEWYENYPFSILESFALGKPVVGAAIGGIPELAVSGKTGYLYEPGNAEELADCIRTAYDDRPGLKIMGEEARAFVESELDPERHVSTLAEIYERAISCG